MDLLGKKVLVAGAGISGVGAAQLLNTVGAEVILYDSNASLTKEMIQERFLEPVPDITILTGALPADLPANLDLAVLSPGVPVDAPFVEDIRSRGVRIWGEVELAYHYMKGGLAAITGTNGKTTTTTLTGRMLEAYYPSVFVVGNIGNPCTQCALSADEDSVTVAEISSFQLETIEDFHPHVSAVLNITPDHLNRHHTMECYINMKKRIFENQTEEDFLILNYDDEITRGMAEEARAQVIWFSGRHVLEEGYYYKDGQILYAHQEKVISVCDSSKLHILGLHNMENVMAATAAASCMGVPFEKITEVLYAFWGVEHRIEFTAEKQGVFYYNDSKGTNPDAAIKAVEAMTRPTILIGGGYDKASEYDAWIESFAGRVKQLVLIGATADKIEACARAHGFTAISHADSLERAVQICAASAEPGDAVLLSPACASWDMFKNYEERGDLFKEYVRNLPDTL